jgi:hypothetical protein
MVGAAVNGEVRGTCLCGTVAYAVHPPYRWFAHCHCSMCRKHHGALFSTGLGVPRERFRWLSGRTSIVHYRATEAFERPFCLLCGSTVPGVSHIPNVLHVPAGGLDGDPGERPRSHIFVASATSFYSANDTLPKYATYPAGVDVPSVDAARSSDDPPPGRCLGSCLCGSITFHVAARFDRLAACHCTLCRHSTGAAFGAWLLASRQDFRWLRGRSLIRAFELAEPRAYATRFCAACGSLMPAPCPGSQFIRVPVSAIDTQIAPPPLVHGYTAQRAAWFSITDERPQFAGPPSADAAWTCF